MIGGEALAPFRRGLEEDGYQVVLAAAGDPLPAEGQPADAVVLELGAVAEDAAVKRMIQEARQATMAFVRPEFAQWLPDVRQHFTFLQP